MKCVFLTNQASYHQMHFARAMAVELGEDNFRIVFQKGTSASRAEMGWKDDYTEPYIIRFAESAEAQDECLRWIDNADVVIQGRFPIKYVRQRIKDGKLTFACQERLWKKPPSWKRKISRFPHLFKNYYSVDKPNYHFLAIGAYAAADLNQLGVFAGRSWRYGYFIDCPESSEVEISESANSELKLLWCARFSGVKQPHKALQILQGLKQNGLAVSLTMIGDGDLRKATEFQAAELGLLEQITFTGWQSQQQVFDHMVAADLFLMTSHHGEGWGLVVNEALSYGCAVLANEQLGSAQWLVTHGENGFLYRDDTFAAVIDEISTLREAGIREMSKSTRLSMQNDWSSKEAAHRTIALANSLLSDSASETKRLFDHGVCSAIQAKN